MYTMSSVSQKYRQQDVLTSNPLELVVMLYDGCIKQLKISALAIEDHNFERANDGMQQAQLILMELVNSLDLRYPIGQDLMELYQFMLTRVSAANADKNPGMLGEVVGLLAGLRESWVTIAKSGVGSVAQMGD